MAKKQDKQTVRRPVGPETQRERWLKYGANVALAMVLVVGIGIALVYLATRSNARVDMTSSGMYSLKPQTVNIIRELDQPVESYYLIWALLVLALLAVRSLLDSREGRAIHALRGGRVMAEASHRATAALSGAQQGWEQRQPAPLPERRPG